VAQLRFTTVSLRLDDHLGGGETFELYLAEVRKTAHILKSARCSAGVRRELLELYAEQAQQAGWAAFDAGWGSRAQQLYETSHSAAHAAGNDALAGNALALDAYRRVSGGESGVDLSARSCRIAASAEQPAVRSLLYQRAAWTYATAGDGQRAREVLGRAEEALVETNASVPAPDWAAWAHSPKELEIMAGRCWTKLGRPLRAVPVLESAMADYDDGHARDKALYLSWLADAYLDAGEVEQAAGVAELAVDLSAGVASARPHARLAEVFDRLAKHSSVRQVADLLARRPLNPSQVGG
jgi:tetratricopeptide (TPR) repeat protein